MSNWVSAEVRARTDWASNLVTLQLTGPELQFKAGQFANLALDIDGKRVRRSYSIASAPGAAPEFYITRVEGGALTPQLSALTPGSSVWLDSNPVGVFTLDWLPDMARELWLIATGTGLGPYISMLRDGTLFPRFDRVVFVHGVRTHAELGYRAELEAATRDERVSYVPLVTREAPTAGVASGRIPGLLLNGELERAARLSLNVEKTHALLCGNPDMIAESVVALEQRGLRRHKRREPGHITLEKYW
jgi:ferredoxin/flavodoxin---NADP+ reductase